jgi:CO dehydrogenase/acetyl-CoA synthase gamma subunit (corrinoid Fe-S protein)
LESEKNKYVVMDDPCIYTTSKQISKTIDQKAKIMEACQAEREKTIEMPEMETMATALKDQKTVLLDAEFENFLIQNRNFWYETNDMFKAWAQSAEVLSNK